MRHKYVFQFVHGKNALGPFSLHRDLLELFLGYGTEERRASEVYREKNRDFVFERSLSILEEERKVASVSYGIGTLPALFDGGTQSDESDIATFGGILFLNPSMDDWHGFTLLNDKLIRLSRKYAGSDDKYKNNYPICWKKVEVQSKLQNNITIFLSKGKPSTFDLNYFPFHNKKNEFYLLDGFHRLISIGMKKTRIKKYKFILMD